MTKKSIRPTTIYWLVDMRPETIAKGWPDGYPFYCGKTVFDPFTRLNQHFQDATRTSSRPVCRLLSQIGRAFVRVHTVEFLPTSENWDERERFWIAYLRKHYPGCTNVCVGGQGVVGYTPPRSTRIAPLPTVASIMKRFKRGTPKHADRMHLAEIRSKRVQERELHRKQREKKLRELGMAL